jgi:hypothetical protein
MMRRRGVRLFTVVVAAAIVLGVLSTLGMAVAAGAFAHSLSWVRSPWGARCDVPAPPGTVVNAAVTDRGSMMRGPYQPGPAANSVWSRYQGMGGMMRIFATPEIVPRETVAIRVINTGAWTYELVILPFYRCRRDTVSGNDRSARMGKSMRSAVLVRGHVPAARPVGPR